MIIPAGSGIAVEVRAGGQVRIGLPQGPQVADLFAFALPALDGWQYVTLISPVFVYVLLTRISGIPLLESRGKKKWGDDPDYQAYKKRTPVLMLRPPRGR